MTLEFHATPEEVMRAVEAVQELGRRQKLADKDIFALAVALEESASTIVDHAYARDPRRTWRLNTECGPLTATLELTDDGPEFDPTRHLARQAGQSSEDAAPGGLGIRVVRKFIDQISYARMGEKNVLRLVKHLSVRDCNDSAKPIKP